VFTDLKLRQGSCIVLETAAHSWREARRRPISSQKYIIESRICVMLMEVEKWSYPHPGPDQHQKLITSRGSPLSTPTMFGRRLLPRSWVIVLTDRTTEQTITQLHQSWRSNNECPELPSFCIFAKSFCIRQRLTDLPTITLLHHATPAGTPYKANRRLYFVTSLIGCSVRKRC